MAQVLPNPTTINANGPSGTLSTGYDDAVNITTLSFPLSIYDIASSEIRISNNGAIGWNSSRVTTSLGSTGKNTALPAFSSLGNTVLAPYWDDLYIYSYTQQGIYYEVNNADQVGNRTVTFEFLMGHYDNDDRNVQVHFLVILYEARPGVVTYKYLNVPEMGSGATVGVQSSAGEC